MMTRFALKRIGDAQLTMRVLRRMPYKAGEKIEQDDPSWGFEAEMIPATSYSLFFRRRPEQAGSTRAFSKRLDTRQWIRQWDH